MFLLISRNGAIGALLYCISWQSGAPLSPWGAILQMNGGIGYRMTGILNEEQWGGSWGGGTKQADAGNEKEKRKQ